MVTTELNAEFEPQIVLKRSIFSEGIEILTVSPYAKGVQDILIIATDNLNGFINTIKPVFPHSTKQICLVSQIRNAARHVV
uniref:transposase n=1 Tax=Lutibacter agarilyticus TaxID=1109740 RepID=UPI000B794381|nr:transposase [Lutibacter agarilyticus]